MKSPTRGPDLRRPGGGFTLIEVLVVIAEKPGGTGACFVIELSSPTAADC